MVIIIIIIIIIMVIYLISRDKLSLKNYCFYLW